MMEDNMEADKQYGRLDLIGSGAYGKVYKVYDPETEAYYAMKVEELSTRSRREVDCLEKIKSKRGFISIKESFQEPHNNNQLHIVFTLVGTTLHDLFKRVENNDEKINLKSVLMIADQLLDRLKILHSSEYVHRDIKTDNLAMGINGDESILYLLDFGMVKRIKTNRNTHIHQSDGHDLIGNSRYCSIHSHKGITLSRRDDLESVSYLLIRMLKGRLPWSDLSNYSEIYEMKKVSTRDLCDGLEDEFREFLKYARNLDFKQKPDYAYCRELFRDLFERKGYENDGIYSWTLPTDAAWIATEEKKKRLQREEEEEKKKQEQMLLDQQEQEKEEQEEAFNKQAATASLAAGGEGHQKRLTILGGLPQYPSPLDSARFPILTSLAFKSTAPIDSLSNGSSSRALIKYEAPSPPSFTVSIVTGVSSTTSATTSGSNESTTIEIDNHGPEEESTAAATAAETFKAPVASITSSAMDENKNEEESNNAATPETIKAPPTPGDTSTIDEDKHIIVDEEMSIAEEEVNIEQEKDEPAYPTPPYLPVAAATVVSGTKRKAEESEHDDEDDNNAAQESSQKKVKVNEYQQDDVLILSPSSSQKECDTTQQKQA